MALYRRKNHSPTDYTTDEEDIITYDVEEDEIEQHPNLVEKDGRQHWKIETSAPAIKAGYLNCKIRPYIPNPLGAVLVPEIKLISTPVISMLSLTTQAELLHLIDLPKQLQFYSLGHLAPMSNDILSGNMFTPIESSSNVIHTLPIQRLF
ncbi:hypothetical protein TNCV_4032561 [Trichonephila clavipes]|nr:hypothetical protein TNCV_4032561 [Trichonephila clavipes]